MYLKADTKIYSLIYINKQVPARVFMSSKLSIYARSGLESS